MTEQHLPGLTPESPCPRVAAGHQPCGLLWQHSGPCVPFVPGGYLPAPMLHSVKWLLRLCPLCNASFYDAFGSAGTVHRLDGDGWKAQDEVELTLLPCRCQLRMFVFPTGRLAEQPMPLFDQLFALWTYYNAADGEPPAVSVGA